MKKSFIFAFVAVVAMIAASCQPKVEAPKARFTSSVDGLTVTFTNASKGDNLTYAWDFGDNKGTSDQKDPVYTYEAAGQYTVKLTVKNAGGENSMSETIELAAKAFSIKVDGDFSDWNDVPADALAEAKVSEDAVLEELYDIKFCSTADYVFFYIEFNGEEDVVGVLDMFINTDDNAETGHDSWLWTGSGADILMEGGIGPDDESGAEMWWPDYFKSIGTGWEWDALEISSAVKFTEIKAIGNNKKALEGSIMRASIPNLTTFKVGVLAQAPEWAGEVGALPATVVDGEGANVVPEMLNVKLN